MADSPRPHAIENHVDFDDRARTNLNAISERALRTALNERRQQLGAPPPSGTHLLRPTRAELPSSSSSKKNSTAATFLASLPTVKLEDLPEHDQSCHICQEDFCDGPDAAEGPERAELPVKLPCNHILGAECLARWCDGHDSCPMCRATLFVRQDVSQSRVEEGSAALEATRRHLIGIWEALVRQRRNEFAFA